MKTTYHNEIRAADCPWDTAVAMARAIEAYLDDVLTDDPGDDDTRVVPLCQRARRAARTVSRALAAVKER